MEFLSTPVQACAALFQRSSFDEARRRVLGLLASHPSELERIEAESLRLRIEIERDEVFALDGLRLAAVDLVDLARSFKAAAALYHLGIVCLLCEDPESARRCFRAVLAEALDEDGRALARYGLAAVFHNKKESTEALGLLDELLGQTLSPDTECLVCLLKGNALRALGKNDAAHHSYLQGQKLLAGVASVHLKNWVFFGLAVTHARRGELVIARTLFEVVLSLTHPVDFKRLHKLASDEMARLETKAEVLFDPVTGDVVSPRGYLCLRRKPTLISILSALIERWPEAVSKEDMYRKVWAGEYHPLRHDGLIYSHIQRLRQILATDLRLKDFVQTVADGYRLDPRTTVKIRDEAAAAADHSRAWEASYEN